MSILTSESACAARPILRPAPLSFSQSLLLACLLCLALEWPLILQIFTTRAFTDPDDVTRLLQVRAWLDGQGWYDYTLTRLDPPHGSFLHWSRVIDVPLAGLIRLFEIFVAPSEAEIFTRIAFPLLLQIALIGLTLWASESVWGARARLACALACVFSCFMFIQFLPGRVDHHAPQIVLLLLMVALTLRVLKNGAPMLALSLPAVVALSLAISVENLPCLIVVGCALPVAWIFNPQLYARPMQLFGVGSCLATPLTFIAFNGPALWFTPHVDAFSIVHVCAAVAGGCVLILCGALSARLVTQGERIIWLCLLGAIAALGLAAAFPIVLGSPYVGIDPLVRALWLDDVREVRSLVAMYRLEPAQVMIFVPLVISLCALVVVALRAKGGKRRQVWFLAAMAAVGLLMSVSVIRALGGFSAIVTLGAVGLAMTIETRLRAWRVSYGRWFGLVGLFLSSSLAWAVLIPTNTDESSARTQEAWRACTAPATLTALAELEPGAVIAPIELGAHLLKYTRLSAFGAPYHRNNHGNRLVLDAFLGQPEMVETLFRANGVRTIVFCPNISDVTSLIQRAPDGLLAQLAEGKAPPWLREHRLSTEILKVWTLR